MNYSFTLNVDQVLDAAFVGNNTRYLNHVTGNKANVTAAAKWVNGEHRIGFYATKNIKRGRELLFDYGMDYWKDQTTHE